MPYAGGEVFWRRVVAIYNIFIMIKYLVMDVDGTLTEAGIVPVIITGRSSKILENRCRELEIENLC